MIPPLDVFAVENSGPMWLGAAESLLDAFKMAREQGAGRYLVVSLETGNKTMYEINGVGELRHIGPASSASAS